MNSGNTSSPLILYNCRLILYRPGHPPRVFANQFVLCRHAYVIARCRHVGFVPLSESASALLPGPDER
eukprot:809841-Prymnesium_polylepis.1